LKHGGFSGGGPLWVSGRPDQTLWLAILEDFELGNTLHTQICFMALILLPVMRRRVHSAYRLVPEARWSS